jgi:hypothetical protein
MSALVMHGGGCSHTHYVYWQLRRMHKNWQQACYVSKQAAAVLQAANITTLLDLCVQDLGGQFCWLDVA